jgi:hypothetical protein
MHLNQDVSVRSVVNEHIPQSLCMHIKRTMTTDDLMFFQSQRVVEGPFTHRASESRRAGLSMVRSMGIELGPGRELVLTHAAMIDGSSPWARHCRREPTRDEGGVFG